MPKRSHDGTSARTDVATPLYLNTQGIQVLFGALSSVALMHATKVNNLFQILTRP